MGIDEDIALHLSICNSSFAELVCLLVSRTTVPVVLDEETTDGCSDKSADGVRMDGDDGEEEAGLGH